MCLIGAHGTVESLPFACALGGFEAVVGDSVVGGFDGRDRRYLRSYAISERRAQLLVSHHELLHHELQWSTAWGVVAAMAGLLARAGVDPDRLTAIASTANASCRWVHEVFATTISVGVLGINEGRELLSSTPRYSDYLETGLALGGDAPWPWQFRESAMQMLLRSLMQPVELLTVADHGFERLRLRDIASDGLGPDERLRVVATDAGRWWEESFADLLQDYPERGGDRGDSLGRKIPDDEQAMERLKTWEETVLIPTLQEVATHNLRTLGINILDPNEYLEAVAALTDSLRRLGPDDWQVEILTDRRPMNAEPLGAEREVILLREERIRTELVDQDELGRRAAEFLADAPSVGKHVLALYILPSVAREQFNGLQDMHPDGPPLLAIVGAMGDEIHGRVLPLAAMKPEISPRALQEMFTSVPLVTLTTLSTTRESTYRDRVLELDRTVVLVDLPLRLQVNLWIESFGVVRFRVVSLHGPLPLTLIIFHIEELPSIWFVAFRGEAGYGELAQLLALHPTALLPGLELPPEIQGAVFAASQRLLEFWYQLDEMGPA